ncbi:hypothetical protein Q8A73_022229 [Channa argus]|nr:hypothetical protein Q8A73_022229 [Channa argus]
MSPTLTSGCASWRRAGTLETRNGGGGSISSAVYLEPPVEIIQHSRNSECLDGFVGYESISLLEASETKRCSSPRALCDATKALDERIRGMLRITTKILEIF